MSPSTFELVKSASGTRAESVMYTKHDQRTIVPKETYYSVKRDLLGTWHDGAVL
jgi:hypothetical protein